MEGQRLFKYASIGSGRRSRYPDNSAQKHTPSPSQGTDAAPKRQSTISRNPAQTAVEHQAGEVSGIKQAAALESHPSGKKPAEGRSHRRGRAKAQSFPKSRCRMPPKQGEQGPGDTSTPESRTPGSMGPPPDPQGEQHSPTIAKLWRPGPNNTAADRAQSAARPRSRGGSIKPIRPSKQLLREPERLRRARFRQQRNRGAS